MPQPVQYQPRPFVDVLAEIEAAARVVLSKHGAEDVGVTQFAEVDMARFFVGNKVSRPTVRPMMHISFHIQSKAYHVAVIGQYTRHRNSLVAPLARLTVKVERDHSKDGPNRVRPGARERTRPKVQKWAEDSPIRKLGVDLVAELDLLTVGLCAPDHVPPSQINVRFMPPTCYPLESESRRKREMWGPNHDRCQPLPPVYVPPPIQPVEDNPWI